MTETTSPLNEKLEPLLQQLILEEAKHLQNTLLPILIENIKRGRFQGKDDDQALFDYVALVVKNYERDHAYVSKIQEERDNDAWTDLASQLYKWAYNYLLKKSFHPGRRTMETAMGYVAEAALSIISAHFPFDVEFDPWACTILYNVCRRQIRNATKKSNIPTEGLVSLVEELHINTDNHNLEKRLEIESMIDQLPKEEWQEVIRNRYLEGLSPKETAEAMGKEISTIYRITYKALEKLREIWP